MTLALVHGFASTSKNKVESLKELFGSKVNVVGVEYDSYSPLRNYEEILFQIRQIMKSDEKLIIIGASLGGLYASNCAHKLDLPLILINPVVNPKWQFERYKGMVAFNYRTMQEDILIDQEYIDEISLFSPQASNIGTLVLVGEDDEIVIPHEVIDTYTCSASICVKQTDHRFDLSLAEDEIWDFINRYRTINE